MIKLTRIHGETVYVNENNIQWIECLPDTTITFLNGMRFIVKEDMDTILELMKRVPPCATSPQCESETSDAPLTGQVLIT